MIFVWQLRPPNDGVVIFDPINVGKKREKYMQQFKKKIKINF